MTVWGSFKISFRYIMVLNNFDILTHTNLGDLNEQRTSNH